MSKPYNYTTVLVGGGGVGSGHMSKRRGCFCLVVILVDVVAFIVVVRHYGLRGL